MSQNICRLSRLVLSKRLLLATAILLLAPALGAQSKPIHVSIDTAQRGTPISPYIYGQFLEHGGQIVNEGVWAEMLEDRKFYYPVTSHPAEDTRTGNWAAGRRRPPLRHWTPIGGDDAVTMDTHEPFAGEHTPLVRTEAGTPHGFEQAGLAVRKGMGYTGRIQLAGTPGTTVQVTLQWGTGIGDRQTVTLKGLSASYRAFPLRFAAAPVDTDDAHLQITGTGAGSFHVGAVSLMPANNVQGFRAEVVNILASLHSGVLRFPGGNYISSYEWRDTVGPIDKRPPIFDNVWGAVQPNDVGIDEFMTLCKLMGVDPYITANAGFGDAWSARELVEYTNGDASTPMGKWRAANGHPAPYHVKLWGIGNEPWGDYQMGAMSTDQFALKHVQFAKAMRAVDPSITLIAGGAMPDVMVGANQSKRFGPTFIPALLSKADWSGYMLAHDLPYIDMLSEHFYSASDMHTDLKLEKKVNIGPQSLVEWERAPATQVRVKYEYYLQYEQLIPGLRERHIPVAIDEWAYQNGPNGRNGYKVVPAYAWAFHEMFRHSDVFQLAAFTFATSMMDANRTEAVINPTGLLFRMYSDHFGVVPVAVSGDSPQPKPMFPAGGDQPAENPGSPTYPLDVSAALSKDGRALTFAVINPSDTPQHMDLSLGTAHVAAHGTMWRMAPKSVDASITIGKPAEVAVEQQQLGALPAEAEVPPFSVTIYAYPLQ